ncbi:helix-turn-helix transcriptional regulator [Modestobacter sp. VKM Ac-2983]|uniref:helix-turn-helix domain-containing protein n=1 Tax=Modestobacter sp. VKM Ac-2983 TaxID=3004137 RepID=UPI0022AB5A1B|nr:helix-turn-helix transcriptional regulator [Modestobacter sp. VKM Ac-2983]MCZ2804337.1 helix-turn-helix transcriptional regulator [Modestobacter sp. VKM Ac-2983]
MARCFDGQRLRDARLAADIRPEQLALAVERSVFTLHAYERGLVHPPVNVLAQLAGVLGRNVDDFLVEKVAA